MSHVETNQTLMNDLKLIERTAEAMGLLFITEKGKKQELKMYDNKPCSADIKLSRHIGLEKATDGTYSFIGDFYYCKGYGVPYQQNKGRFSGEFLAKYAELKTDRILTKQKFRKKQQTTRRTKRGS